MKVFVSVPMNGRSDAEVFAVMQRCQSGHIDWEVMDSYVREDAPTDGERSGIWYLGKSLLTLSMADAALFADGWQTARGCRMEHAVCEEYGIPVMYA